MQRKSNTTLVCAVLACVFAVGLGVYSVLAMNPPRALPKDAPPDQFSAHRAIEHAFACSMETHPAGSINNDRVAQYFYDALKGMGVETEFMSKPAVKGDTVELQQAVIGRIRGTDSTGAIAFSAHYDSVPYGPGATDDIAGCIAMLETARAFMNQPRMRNDLLFVFADAEEIGGYGASGFCKHPLAQDIGVITELDVRGTKGPAVIYELSSGNGALISELRKAKKEGVPPLSNSLMFAVYDASPFGSDFTKFRNAGMKGYSIAYLDNFMWYHTANDSPEHINPDSIQHFGAYAMGLSRHFGDVDFKTLNLQSSNDVYFNTLGFNMVQYPMRLAALLTALALGALFVVAGFGLLRKRLRLSGYLKALLLFPVAALLSAFAAIVMQCIVFGLKNTLHLYTVKFTYIPEPRALYDGNLYCCAFALMAIAVTGALYGLASRRLRAEELHAAVLTWLCPVAIGLTVKFPGGEYLGTWPVLFGALGLAVLCFGSREEEPGAPLLLLALLFAAPALCLLLPGWLMLVWMANILAAPATAVVAVLILINLMPLLVLLGRLDRAWLVWVFAGGTAVILLVIGLIIGKPSKDRPRIDSVTYAADLDTKAAWWMSEDEKVDEWTQQFFPDGTRAAIDDVLPGKNGNHYLRASAPVASNLTGLQCKVLKDETVDGKRRIRFKLSTGDAPFRVRLKQTQGPEIIAATVNSMPVSTGGSSLSLCFNLFPRDGYEVTIEAASGEAIAFEARSSIYGFPKIPGIRPRPEHIVPESNIMRNGISLRGEHLYVKNSFTL